MGALREGNLTVKQENFCQRYVELGNAKSAYELSYNCEKSNDTTKSRRAVELLDNPAIITRVKELRTELSAGMMLEKHQVVKMLMDIVNDYRDFKDMATTIDPSDLDAKEYMRVLAGYARSADAISALKQVSKMLGWDAAEKVEVEHKGIVINIIKPEEA